MGPESFLLILPFAACLAIFWGILKFSSAKIATQYRLLAERFGLELSQPLPKMGGFVRPDPSLYGEYRGREISFSAPGKGLKDTRQMETVLKLELRDKRMKARMMPTGLFGGRRQRESGGLTRWESGDRTLDQAVDVLTNRPEPFEVMLAGERRPWLAGNLKGSKASVLVGDGTIAYVKLGMIADEATRLAMEEAVEFLCDFAEAVEG